MLAIIEILTQQEVPAVAVRGTEQAERLRAFSEELRYRQHENLVIRLSEIHKKLATVSRVSAALGAGSLCLSLIDAEDSFGDYERTLQREVESSTGTALRAMGSILTLVLLWSVVRFHTLDYERQRIRKKAAGPRFQHSPQCFSMIAEVCLFSIHCPPACNREFEYSQLRGSLVLSALEVTTAVMFCRLYLLLRALRFSSRWGARAVEDRCNEFGCHASTKFMLKAYFQHNPYLVLTISFLCSLLVFGLIIRLLERPYAIDNGTGQNYAYVWNALWMVVITMFTVGYGDFYPQTHLGRALVVLACLWGMFLISMLVVQMARATVHGKEEAGAFRILSRIWKQREIVPAAGRAIVAAFRYRRRHGSYGQVLDALIDFRAKKLAASEDLGTVRDVVHVFEENLMLDFDELFRLSCILQDLFDRLKEVESQQAAALNSVRLSIAHTSAVLRELQGSEVLRNA